MKESDKIKGVICFPCCPKEKVITYGNARGCASIKCPNCGRFTRFDYDRQKAVSAAPMVGVINAMKNNRLH